MLDRATVSALPRAALIDAYAHLERHAAAQEQRAREQEQRAHEQEQRSAALAGENAELHVQLEWLRKQIFGQRSERSQHPDPQQQSFLDAPVAHDETPADPAETETITYERKKPGGRKPVSRELPTEEIVLRASDEERVGPNGERLVSLGFEVTERLHIVPEKLLRLIIKREKLGLADTRELAYTVPPEPCLVPGGKATDAFLHEVVLRKYHQGLPLYRQLGLYNAQGADLADNFLVGCVRHVAAAYAPIAASIRIQVLAQAWVQVDETPVRQLRAPEGVRTAYFWAWVAGGQVSIHFGPTRSRAEVRDVLGIPYDPGDPRDGSNGDLDPGSWEHGSHIGFLVCDGYTGYDHVFAAGTIRRVACWAHARRKFKAYEEVDANARRLVALINDAFRVDRRARKDADKQRLRGAERTELLHARRQEHSAGIVAAIRTELAALAPLYSPDSGMREAVGYALNQWDALTVFLDHGFLPMDNNQAERVIRPIAIGRKNWLFVGSEDGGEWAAILYSIIESCRLQKIDPRRYFEYVTPILVQTTAEQLDAQALTPAAMRSTLL